MLSPILVSRLRANMHTVLAGKLCQYALKPVCIRACQYVYWHVFRIGTNVYIDDSDSVLRSRNVLFALAWHLKFCARAEEVATVKVERGRGPFKRYTTVGGWHSVF